MVAVMFQKVPRFYKNFSKNRLFISANTFKNFLITKAYCIARHDDKMGFLPNCWYHIVLIGNNKELLEKMDTFFFNYQHVDCLHRFSKYHFRGKIVVKSGQLLIICRRQFNSTTNTEEWRECPALRKRNPLEKNTENICWADCKRPNRRKLVDHCLQTELDKVKRLKSN